ncbi:MAG: PAS domain-containing protein [Luteibaculaceae bacterium]
MKTIAQLIPDWLKNSSHFSVVVVGLDGYYKYVNHKFSLKYNFSNSEYVGTPFMDSVHPEDVDICNQASLFCIKNPEKSIVVKIRKPNLEGGFTWTEWEFYLLSDNKKNPLGIVSVGVDVTEKVNTIKELEQSKVLLEKIYKNTPEAFTIVDANFKIIYNNRAAKFISKIIFNKEAAAGEDIFDFIEPQYRDEFLQFTKRVFVGEDIEYERFVNKKWYRVRLTPIFKNDSEVVGFVYSVLDVDKNKRAELNSEVQREVFKEFAGKKSYQIRQPLANILAITRILASEEDAIKALEGVDYIHLLEKSATELDNMVTQVIEHAYGKKEIE